MQKIALFIFILLLGQAVKDKAQYYAIATINADCVSQPASLDVPIGEFAYDFKLTELTAGMNCYSGEIFDHQGFCIKSADTKVVYQCLINKKGKVNEKGGSLETLKLKTGTYKIWVDGGKGAQLVLNYQIKIPHN